MRFPAKGPELIGILLSDWTRHPARYDVLPTWQLTLTCGYIGGSGTPNLRYMGRPWVFRSAGRFAVPQI